jgi:hypothetical protein
MGVLGCLADDTRAGSTDRSVMRRVLLVTVSLASLAGCAPEQAPFAAHPESTAEYAVSAAVRRERAELIRDSAAAKGVTNGVLFAGIGQAETGLAHCDSEVGYGCPGPGSPTCGGAPILAGGADGPCSAEQGGLGMFQFDSGTYDQTLNTYGPEVLTIEGNAGFAVEFMIARIILSVHVDNVDTREEAIAFINSVEPGGTNWNAWLTSVTHYYNGCSPSGCSIFDSRFAGYRDSTLFVLNEFGEEFWSDIGPPPPPPVCEVIPAEGRTIEEDDDCATAGGPLQYWRTEQDGSAGRLHWTHTTDDAEAANFAEWKLDFANAGRYELAVYTDASFAESHQALYVVAHEGGESDVVIDQTAVDGFQSLGTFDFAAGVASVRVDDNTGEPLGADNTRLVFDALRITPAPVEEPEDPEDPEDPVDEDPEDPQDPQDPQDPEDPKPEDPLPEDEQPLDDEGNGGHVAFVPSVEGTCASTSPSSFAGFALLLVGLARMRRRV